MDFVDIFDELLGILVAASQVALALYVIAFFFRKKNAIAAACVDFVSANALMLIFAVSTTATLGSLFYSEIAGYSPCIMCWYQRIVMYPQVLIAAVALLRKHRTEVWDYLLVMSVVGFIIGAWQYLGQIGVASGLPCPAMGYSASCAQTFTMQFGYITIPLMAVTGFAMNILFAWTGKNAQQK